MQPTTDARSTALSTKTAQADDSRTPTKTGVGLGSPSPKSDPASDRRASSASPRQVDGTARGVQADTQGHHASKRGPTYRPQTTAKPAWFGQGAFGDVGTALLSRGGILAVHGGEDVKRAMRSVEGWWRTGSSTRHRGLATGNDAHVSAITRIDGELLPQLVHLVPDRVSYDRVIE